MSLITFPKTLRYLKAPLTAKCLFFFPLQKTEDSHGEEQGRAARHGDKKAVTTFSHHPFQGMSLSARLNLLSLPFERGAIQVRHFWSAKRNIDLLKVSSVCADGLGGGKGWKLK